MNQRVVRTGTAQAITIKQKSNDLTESVEEKSEPDVDVLVENESSISPLNRAVLSESILMHELAYTLNWISQEFIEMHNFEFSQLF